MRFILLGLAMAAAGAPATPTPKADVQSILQRDQGRLLETVQDWGVYLAKLQPDVKQRFGPDLAEIKDGAGAAQSIEELRPQQLRLDAWRRNLLGQLFPSLPMDAEPAGDATHLAQAQVEAFQALDRLQQSSLSAREQKAVQNLKSRVSVATDAESLGRLFDNAGFARPAPLPQAAFGPGAAVQTAAARPASRLTAAPPPAEPPMVLKDQSILAYLDWNKGKELAHDVWQNVKGFSGYCYAAVKDALDTILPKGWRGEVAPASAYQFASSLNGNPKLFDKLKLRKIDPRTLPGKKFPVGAIIVYGRGMCGFNAEHGHIEIVVSSDPPKACSDGCEGIPASRLQCIDKYSAKGWVNVYEPVRTPAS
jgi:hypothetical protein